MAVELPSRNSDITMDGLQITEHLTWASWKPGGEYTKKVTVKNVAYDKRRIDFTVPKSKFFGTLIYPKPVTLNPGTSYSMPVVFKPLENKLYEDKIELKTKNKKIEVAMKAVLPEAEIQAPDHLHFGYCAVKDCINIKFQVKNLSCVPLALKWKTPDVFSVTPREAALKASACIQVEMKFSPEMAAVYEGQAILVYDKHKWKSIKVEGIGKYAHVSLNPKLDGLQISGKAGDLEAGAGGGLDTFDHMFSDESLDFGVVDSGSLNTRSLQLHNTSNVNAMFTVTHLHSGRDVDKYFYCSTPNGVIAAHGKTEVRFSYQPGVGGHTHVDYFAVTATGKLSRTVIKCTGAGKGPTLSASTDHLDFGIVNLGSDKRLTFTLTNSDSMPAIFQFDSCNFPSDSVFHVSPSSGVVTKGSPLTVEVLFTPSHSIGYHKRLLLFVNQQVTQDVLFLDLFGVSHCDEFKPSAIRHSHVIRHFQQMKNGLGKLSPEHLVELLAKNKLTMDSGALDWSRPEYCSDQSERGDDSCVLPTYDSLFAKEPQHAEKFVTLDKKKFDFGRVNDCSEPMQQTLNITNNTKAKVTVVWTAAAPCPSSGSPGSASSGGQSSCFWVEPRLCEIAPLKAQSFRVLFKPDGFDKFFGTQLEAFAFFKVMRDHKLVSDARCITLPRRVGVQVAGHSFRSPSDTFKAQVHTSTRHITMPPCVADMASYQTLYLSNQAPTPMTFSFDPDPKGHFQVYPQSAMLNPNSTQVCVVRFQSSSAEAPHLQSFNLQCHLNHNPKYLKLFHLRASVDSPQLLIDKNAMVYLRPGAAGETVAKKFPLRNNSRLPLKFEWSIAKADQEHVSVEPSSGLLLPNEIQAHQIRLRATGDKVCHYKPFIKVSSDLCKGSPSQQKEKEQVYKVQVLCESVGGRLECVEGRVDMGEVVCGNRHAKSFTLFNCSPVPVSFALSHSQQVRQGDTPYSQEQITYDKPALEIEPMEGFLPARTRKTIKVVVNPRRRVDYEFTVFGKILKPKDQKGAGTGDGDDSSSACMERELCVVTVRGMFPCVQVLDAQCFGAADNMSKIYLWRLLNIDRLNQVLDADPEESELRYSAVSRMSMESSRAQGGDARGGLDLHNTPSGSAAVNMNFGAAPSGSPDTQVVLLFQNTSHVQTNWNFFFPGDLKLELEFWAQTGDFSEQELHQLMVADNSLFSICPQTGSLAPGESVAITFTYRHLFPGTNRIPVLLKLDRGREVVLNLVGVTVEPHRKYLHFASPVHQFRSVAIAGSEPPQQLYELYNGGAVPLKCTLDLTALESCKAENFNCAVFECLDKELYIEPGRTAPLRWMFSPLEAKLYSVQVAINIHGGETALVTFEGLGFDKRELGDGGVDNSEDLVEETIPTRQLVPKAGQQVFLSQERLAFGDLPLFTRGRRVVCLTNTSPSDTIDFHWKPNDDPYSKCVHMTPLKGSLAPGQTTMFKVTFTATGFPSFYNLDFVCQIVNSSQMARYESDVRNWELLKTQQDQEFTITEQNAHEAHKMGAESPLKNMQLKNAERVSTPSELDFKHYETLPPIKKTRGDKDHRRSNRRQKEVVAADGAPIWERPVPPTPFIMHLGVTARTHNVQEFEESFGTLPTFFIDRTLSKDFETDLEKLKKKPERIVCLESECNLAIGVFTSLLKSMFEDSTFHAAVRSIQKEPVPYFAQLRSPSGHYSTAGLRRGAKTPAAHSPEDETSRGHPTGGGTRSKGGKDAGSGLGSREELQQRVGGEGEGGGEWSAWTAGSEGAVESQVAIHVTEATEAPPPPPEFQLNTDLTYTSGFYPAELEQDDDEEEGPAAQLLKSVRVDTTAAAAPVLPQTPPSCGGHVLAPNQLPSTPQLRKIEENSRIMETLKSDAETAVAVEKILENSISNIINEGMSQLFNPVMKPRLVAWGTGKNGGSGAALSPQKPAASH